jgi:negative regulator of flagellin synthesis FlgM
MKIGNIDNKTLTVPVGGERKAGGPGAATQAEPSAKVELSQTASALTGAAADGAFDASKVDRIAQAIRDGRFTVNAEAIADRLIANAQELLGNTSR